MQQLPPSELEFYELLRSHDASQPDTAAALAFARLWQDLAQRVIAAYSAQQQVEVEYPPALPLPVFKALVEHGPQLTEAQLFSCGANRWPGHLRTLLSALACWQATRYDPADPVASSCQVLVGNAGQRHISLYCPGGAAAPPAPFQLLPQTPGQAAAAQLEGRPAALIGHYDVHGISMLALTMRSLRQLDVDEINGALSFEWTGDISKLWKRAVPKTALHEKGYGLVVLIDCSIHSRKPEYTLKAISKLEQVPHCRLLIVDHHPDTFRLAPELLHPQVDLLLTDIPSCGLVGEPDDTERELMLLGAIGDKLPEIHQAYPEHDTRYRHLYDANRAFHQRAIQFSPTPKELKDEGIYPLEPLWEALASGRRPGLELDRELFGDPPQLDTPSADGIRHMACGSLVVVTEQLKSVGRLWYGLLEKLMVASGLPYAAALRILDARRANLLLLTKWDATHLPPVRMHIPDEYAGRLLGHPGATWADLPVDQALTFLHDIERSINSFVGESCDFSPIAAELTRNIIEPGLDQPPSSR